MRGGLVIGASEAGRRESVVALAKTGTVNVILNFAEAKEIDDDGLGALIVCDARLRKSGGALKLLKIDRVHMDVSVLMRLAAVFEVFKDEQDAIDSFFPGRVPRHYDILEFVEERGKCLSPEHPE